MELNWSRWFRCESSFGPVPAPHQPGIFALAEEVAPAGVSSHRLLAVFEIGEGSDISLAISRLFASSGDWRKRLEESACYLRYAVVPIEKERQAATLALRKWLTTQFDSATQIFGPQRVPAYELKTVAERAVDRVTGVMAEEGEGSREWSRPAGF